MGRDFFFFFQAEDGIRDLTVTGVQTCALPISQRQRRQRAAQGARGAAAALAVPARSEERRVGKSVDLGGRRIIKKKKTKKDMRRTLPSSTTPKTKMRLTAARML